MRRNWASLHPIYLPVGANVANVVFWRTRRGQAALRRNQYSIGFVMVVDNRQ